MNDRTITLTVTPEMENIINSDILKENVGMKQKLKDLETKLESQLEMIKKTRKLKIRGIKSAPVWKNKKKIFVKRKYNSRRAIINFGSKYNPKEITTGYINENLNKDISALIEKRIEEVLKKTRGRKIFVRAMAKKIPLSTTKDWLEEMEQNDKINKFEIEREAKKIEHEKQEEEKKDKRLEEISVVRKKVKLIVEKKEIEKVRDGSMGSESGNEGGYKKNDSKAKFLKIKTMSKPVTIKVKPPAKKPEDLKTGYSGGGSVPPEVLIAMFKETRGSEEDEEIPKVQGIKMPEV